MVRLWLWSGYGYRQVMLGLWSGYVQVMVIVGFWTGYAGVMVRLWLWLGLVWSDSGARNVNVSLFPVEATVNRKAEPGPTVDQ